MHITDFPSLRMAFGTYKNAADALGMSPQALNDARRRGSLPKHSFIAHKATLEQHGHTVALSLWGFEEPDATPQPAEAAAE